MRLSCDPDKFSGLTINELIQAIVERRNAIRVHCAQRMDDRCWLDDFPVWQMLDDTLIPNRNFLISIGMTRCKEFYSLRKSETADSVSLKFHPDWTRWDNDIVYIRFSKDKLVNELFKIQLAIRVHRDTKPGTAHADRRLYSVLPEKLPVDLRLPSEEEFLGEAKAPYAGCPSFWRSHKDCDPETCNLHQWGPCPTNP